MKKLYKLSILFLLLLSVILSLKIHHLKQVDVLNIQDNENGTYTLEIQQGKETYTYHYED